MLKMKNFIMITAALVFCFGVLSLGYGYWADRLNFEGRADVRVYIDVEDDIVQPAPVSPAALEIEEDQSPSQNANRTESVEEPSSGSPASEIIDHPPAENPGNDDEAQPGSDPEVKEPIVNQPADQPAAEPGDESQPAAEPVDESQPAAEPVDESQPAADPGDGSQTAGDQGGVQNSGESVNPGSNEADTTENP